MLVLPEMGIADASDRADQIRKRVGQYDFSTPEAAVGRVTVSIGVAAYPDNGKEWKSVFRAADATVYTSKQAAETE